MWLARVFHAITLAALAGLSACASGSAQGASTLRDGEVASLEAVLVALPTKGNPKFRLADGEIVYVNFCNDGAMVPGDTAVIEGVARWRPADPENPPKGYEHYQRMATNGHWVIQNAVVRVKTQ